jgi:purine-binding chemotaxis protein CheW
MLLGRPGTKGRRLIVLEGEAPVGLAVDEIGAVADDPGVPFIEIDPLLSHAFGDRTAGGTRGRAGIVADDRSISEAGATIALVAFAIGDQEFALPIDQVEEVLRLPGDIAVLPGADAAVLGTVAVRGALLPLLSLAALLGLPGGLAGRGRRVVVVRVGQHRVGLQVDAMRAVLQIDETLVDPVPAALARGSAEARIQAICRLDDGRRLVSVLAADHLLRAELMTHLLQSGEGEVDHAAADQDDTAEPFLLFRVGEEDFALPLAAVEEVALLPERLTRLPRAPDFVEGVMNLRGRVLPVIDQGRRFRGEATGGRRRRVIVIRAGELDAGFIVDAVSEVLHVPAYRLRPAPELGDGGARVFDRIANLEEQQRLILIVSPQELLDRAERDLLAALRGEGVAEAP